MIYREYPPHPALRAHVACLWTARVTAPVSAAADWTSRVLVGGLKKVRAHDGSMRLICNQERLLKIFRITGLAKVFTIHGSQAEALADL